MSQHAFKIKFFGLVQGVGFRPFCFDLATSLKINGEVYNNGFGVELILCCEKALKDEFLKKLKANLPPLARIDRIEISKEKLAKTYINFTIKHSQESAKITPILSDFGICEFCKNELYDKKNPRFHYAFITCTHCGPRFSIIKKLPYDRVNTTMSDFKMCEFCKNEYENPKNRRFHAQPISCFDCKISIFLKNKNGEILASDNEALKKVSRLLKNGKILAFKGLGGFHLICDALNLNAIKNLRERKNRPKKPFALMCKDIKMAKNLAFINKSEENLLKSKIAPIVLLKAKNTKTLNELSPNSKKIGIMLAYSPLHLLLFEYFKNPIIATSANLSGESIIFDEANLLLKLNGVFDFYLDYDREIVNSSDDSIAQVLGRKSLFLRTSRSLNPSFIDLANHKFFKNLPDFEILAAGSELKNEFVIFYDKKLLISPYIGDLKSVVVNERYFALLDFFKKTYDLNLQSVILDKHPNFSFSKQLENEFKSVIKVQHHYAHFCAALFEANVKEKALGFIMDGTGYGDDKSIWGGEILLGDTKTYERIAHFDSFKLINADIKNAQNLALSVILHYNLESLASEFLSKFEEKKLKNLKKIYEISTLKTSSLGRIIDALGAIILGINYLSYEAQSGLELESLYDKNLNFAYEIKEKNGVLDFSDIIKGALTHDKITATTGFFNALANFIVKYSSKFKLKVILSGGVFQNKTLLEILLKKRLKFFIPQNFPCNDSGIALGQMVHFLSSFEKNLKNGKFETQKENL